MNDDVKKAHKRIRLLFDDNELTKSLSQQIVNFRKAHLNNNAKTEDGFKTFFKIVTYTSFKEFTEGKPIRFDNNVGSKYYAGVKDSIAKDISSYATLISSIYRFFAIYCENDSYIKEIKKVIDQAIAELEEDSSESREYTELVDNLDKLIEAEKTTINLSNQYTTLHLIGCNILITPENYNNLIADEAIKTTIENNTSKDTYYPKANSNTKNTTPDYTVKTVNSSIITTLPNFSAQFLEKDKNLITSKEQLIDDLIAKKLKDDLYYNYLSAYRLQSGINNYNYGNSCLANNLPTKKDVVLKYDKIDPEIFDFIRCKKILHEVELENIISSLNKELGGSRLRVGCAITNLAIIVVLEQLKKLNVPINVENDSYTHNHQWLQTTQTQHHFAFSTGMTHYLTRVLKRGEDDYIPVLPVSGQKQIKIYKRNPKTNIPPQKFKHVRSFEDCSSHAEDIIMQIKYETFFKETTRSELDDTFSNNFKIFENMNYDEIINIWEPFGSLLVMKYKEAEEFNFNNDNYEPYLSIVNLLANKEWYNKNKKIGHYFLKLFIHQWNVFLLQINNVSEGLKIYKNTPLLYDRFGQACGFNLFKSFGTFAPEIKKSYSEA